MDLRELPLFPLNTVLFPGGPLRLRIFEARYLDMVRDCMKTDSDFGVVAIRHGGEVGPADVHPVGTTAEIVDWTQEPDGLLGLAVAGRRRFRIEALAQQPDGLYLGRVDWLAPETAVPLGPDDHWAGELLRGILVEAMGNEAESVSELEDAAWVGWRLAELLPLELADRQALLELDDVGGRLARLHVLVERLELARQTGARN